MSVLVTGANSSIGATIVRRLLSTGTPIVATYHVHSDTIKSLAGNEPLVCLHGPFDITSEENVQALTKVPEIIRGLEGVVNGASYSHPSAWKADLLSCQVDILAKTFRVEVVGALQLLQTLRPYMTEHSSVVLFGSADAIRSDLDTAIYNPAKIAVCSLAKHLAQRMSPNTRVNVVAPGAIGTDWIDRWNISPSEIQEFKASTRGLRRLGRPEELAEVVAFLLGHASSYINGQVIAVDGGSQL
jgi:NAD(P)-dependent dehydrogenase (short-subunit alcohol dehydrogenase family)